MQNPLVPSLLEDHLPHIEGYVRRHAGGIVRRRETDSDLVQSVCRNALQHAGGYRHRDAPGFRRWLYEIARNKLISKHRFHTRQRRGHEPVAASPDTAHACPASRTPSRDAAANEELAALHRALARLPEPYRRVITLARLDGCPHREIAHRLGRSECATRHLLARALTRLSSLLE